MDITTGSIDARGDDGLFDGHNQPKHVANQGFEAFKDIVFGSVAGMVGKIIEYPFDTVKVRLQSQHHQAPLQYAGPLDCFRQSFVKEGVAGLYRGVSAPLVGAAVENSSLFFSYRLAQDAVRHTYLGHSEPLSIWALVGCGAVSGAFTSLLLTPIELIKCKMQVPLQGRPGEIRLPGPLVLIASIYRHDGILGFWHGQLGTLIRETGGSAAWFGSYEGTKLFLRNLSNSRGSKSDTTDITATIYHQMTAGAVAGMTYNLMFYPADTIKSQMQTEDVAGEKRTFGRVASAVWHQQGVKGFYRGCGITVARAAPSSAVIFTLYEALRKAFE